MATQILNEHVNMDTYEFWSGIIGNCGSEVGMLGGGAGSITTNPLLLPFSTADLSTLPVLSKGSAVVKHDAQRKKVCICIWVRVGEGGE